MDPQDSTTGRRQIPGLTMTTHQSPCWFLLLSQFLAPALSIAVLAGCIAEPVVYRVRMRSEIVNVDERALSFQLVTPGAVNPERVIYHGALVSALLEDSEDTPDDFSLGYLRWGEWKRGPVKVLLQESGKTQVVSLGPPPSSANGVTLYIDADVPAFPATAVIRWGNERVGVERSRCGFHVRCPSLALAGK